MSLPLSFPTGTRVGARGGGSRCRSGVSGDCGVGGLLVWPLGSPLSPPLLTFFSSPLLSFLPSSFLIILACIANRSFDRVSQSREAIARAVWPAGVRGRGSAVAAAQAFLTSVRVVSTCGALDGVWEGGVKVVV